MAELGNVHPMTLRCVPVCTALATVLLMTGSSSRGLAQSDPWPFGTAPHITEISKASGLEDPSGLPDKVWIHLRRGHHSAPDAAQATLQVRLLRNANYWNAGASHRARTRCG